MSHASPVHLLLCLLDKQVECTLNRVATHATVSVHVQTGSQQHRHLLRRHRKQRRLSCLQGAPVTRSGSSSSLSLVEGQGETLRPSELVGIQL